MFNDKIKTISLEEFKTKLNKEKEVVCYIVDGKKVVKSTLSKASVLGITAATFIIFSGTVSASSGIDDAARGIYSKLLLVGKWIIIIKGGIDTVNNVVQGDFGTAKKSFLSYLVIYIILQGLPWAMDEVDKTFKSF